MDINKRSNDSHKPNRYSSYRILSKLGHGAYGTVYKAQHINTKEILAIKAVQVEEDELIEDYMTEINLVQNLSHKNIVKCYGFEKRVNREEPSNAFRRKMKSQRCELLIFLEYCSNGSLKDMMNDESIFPGKFIPEKLAKGYIKQTLEGLKYLHEQGVIHRDIKCANLLVSSKDNIIKLADFGISTQITNTLKSGVRNGNEDVAMTCIGSPNWMAPEILLGQGATSKSDIWSLGSTLVEMLTGKPPFYNLNNREAVCYAIVHDYFIFTKKDRERLSSSSLLFVDYLFNKNIFERPSAKDLLEKKFIDSTKNSSWLFEEDDDLQLKNDKLKRFRESDNDNQVSMFDDDFITVENTFQGHQRDKYETGESTELQDSPFKQKVRGTKELNSNSLREAFVSLARTDFIIDKIEKEKLNSFEVLKIIEEINNTDLTKLIINKLIVFNKSKNLEYNLMTFFKVLFGKIDKLGLEMTAKINDLLNSLFSLNGSDCLVLYWTQILNNPSPENLKTIKMWMYVCLLNNGLDKLVLSPVMISFLQRLVVAFDEVDSTIWKLVLKIAFNVITKYGDFYISIYNSIIDYLVKIERFDNEKDLEVFKLFFLKITEINAHMNTSQIKLLITKKITKNKKLWDYFLVKILNNILKNSNEKKSNIDLDNDLKVKSIENKSVFVSNIFFKKWIFENICDELLDLKFDDLLDFKFCRYVFELVYNMFVFQPSSKLMFIDKSFLLFTCERLILLRLDPSNVDTSIIKYHRYDLKLIIKLISDLAMEFDNKGLDLSLWVYEYYAYVSLLYLQSHITYSTYAIDTLSNCCYVLLRAKVMTFPNVKTMQLSVDGKTVLNTDLRLFLNGFIEMNLIKNTSVEDKKVDGYKSNGFDLVFKSIHKLLSSMTISADNEVVEDQNATKDDIELLFTKEYSPLALFIVDHANFFEIVQTILDRYQGSLILQIDFLKFLKLVFKQYVGFKINYYMNKENLNQADCVNKKTQSYSNLKQDMNTGDMIPKRTQNFKLVRDYLLSLWEQSPKKTNADNLTMISSVHSSPKKILNMSNQEKGFAFSQHIHDNMKPQGRVGHNSIIIKTLLRDIDLIYKQSITLA
ncbi:uncharacterized protein HGUI_02774 [Hanseniaspora guilliermondii]|uniref:non-specific serine/threonine protein kinase n=1 Tax=Hanseniaspora guilliermondii TaxID=56406 RepID=A0A1L0FLX3_9ASCO|nr:uncharacterized protein HGUI_02774 [Hanseniaspora guilliermondii]